ncbi:hypothetical protein [Sphingomonas yabuuchiae]|uniref:Uncharacterized protein n=1 Tax=Sphingomonas yabuuchiae TaxID=172044 RepID=A0AA41DEL7_9SPHN|nr:hypothetical protein [Sphingomonas yabuuchiae]MBB4609942.1 hypothetical protein [Sphingomonas yabuuchiae]MBN3558432.1 hypothetical protein [Sphingomonas yabuuchiae]
MTNLAIGAAMVSPVIGFLLALIQRPTVRRVGLIMVILAPLLAFTLFLASARPGPLGYFAWWLTGLVMLAPFFAVWTTLTLIGFSAGRWSLR